MNKEILQEAKSLEKKIKCYEIAIRYSNVQNIQFDGLIGRCDLSFDEELCEMIHNHCRRKQYELIEKIRKTMNERIEQAASSAVENLYQFVKQSRDPHGSSYDEGYLDAIDVQGEFLFKEGAEYALNHQWIPVEEIRPCADEIIAKLSDDFCCGNGRVEILHYCKQDGLRHPEGYYNICGENVPTSAITYWMERPEIGGEL